MAGTDGMLADPGLLGASDFRRFISKVEASPGGCWTWAASVKPAGYGQFRHRRATCYAHRVSYEHFVGPIPDGLEIDHLCRNRLCVNPLHLEPVTRRENTLRAPTVSALNATKTHCPHGHPYDEANTCHSGGGRYCRACAREKMRRRKRATDELVKPIAPTRKAERKALIEANLAEFRQKPPEFKARIHKPAKDPEAAG